MWHTAGGNKVGTQTIMTKRGEKFEALIDRARREGLTESDRRRLITVLQSNPEASLEWWLLSDFAAEQEPQDGDGALIEGALMNAMRRIPGRESTGTLRQPGNRGAQNDTGHGALAYVLNLGKGRKKS